MSGHNQAFTLFVFNLTRSELSLLIVPAASVRFGPRLTQDIASSDKVSYTVRMRPAQFRKFIEDSGLTQAEAGALIDVTERQMRRYVSGETPVPRVVVYALLYAIEQRKRGKMMTRPVGVDELDRREVQSFVEARDKFRDAKGSPGFFHSAPIRDSLGRLCEVRFYKDSDGQEPLALVGIDKEGQPQRLEWL
jgi:hypothetical protein